MGSALNITFNDRIDETDEEQVKEFELSMYQLNSIYRFNRFLEFGIESIPSRVAVAVGMQNMTKMEGQYVYELSKRQVSLYTSQVHQKSDVLSIQQAVIMLGGMMEGQAPDPYRASTFYRLNTLNLHFVHKQSKDFLFSSLKDFDISAGEYTNKAQSYISEFEKDVLEFMSLKPEALAEVKYPDKYTITDEVKELFKKDPAMKKRLDYLIEAETKANKRLYKALKLEKELNFISEVVSNLNDKNSKAKSLKANIDLLSSNFSSNFLEVNKNLSNFKKLVSTISIEELNNSKSIESLVNLYDYITTSIEDLKAGFRNKEFVDYLKLIHNYAFQKRQVDEIHKHPLSEKYYERMQTFVALHQQIELLESKITELITKEQESAKKVRSVYLNIAPSISKVAEQKAQYEAYKATGTVEGVYTSSLEFTLNFLTSYSKFSEKTLPAIIDSKPRFRASITRFPLGNGINGNSVDTKSALENAVYKFPVS